VTLEDWDQKVSPHLQFIEAGADMAVRHAMALPVRPGFESLAEHELRRVREVLQDALTNVIIAQNAYQAKPLETA
jgi:hypothetical protein